MSDSRNIDLASHLKTLIRREYFTEIQSLADENKITTEDLKTTYSNYYIYEGTFLSLLIYNKQYDTIKKLIENDRVTPELFSTCYKNSFGRLINNIWGLTKEDKGIECIYLLLHKNIITITPKELFDDKGNASYDYARLLIKIAEKNEKELFFLFLDKAQEISSESHMNSWAQEPVREFYNEHCEPLIKKLAASEFELIQKHYDEAIIFSKIEDNIKAQIKDLKFDNPERFNRIKDVLHLCVSQYNALRKQEYNNFIETTINECYKTYKIFFNHTRLNNFPLSEAYLEQFKTELALFFRTPAGAPIVNEEYKDFILKFLKEEADNGIIFSPHTSKRDPSKTIRERVKRYEKEHRNSLESKEYLQCASALFSPKPEIVSQEKGKIDQLKVL